LVLEEANSPVIVTVVPLAVVSIPVPPVKVNPSPIVAAAVDPSSAVKVISFASIQPFVAVKFTLSKEATPLFAPPAVVAVVASSPVIVITCPDTLVSMPVPPTISSL